jgi:antitoxin PrlF
MPVVTLKAKGQMTIPKEIRRALDLKPSEKVMVTLEGDQAVLKPLKGDILLLGGSIKIPSPGKPIDFKKVRKEVQKKVALKTAAGNPRT